MEAVAETFSQNQKLDETGIGKERGGTFRLLLTRRLVYVALRECPTHSHQCLPSDDRLGKSIGSLEQACSKEMNRRMRPRMYGGVGGVRSNPAPIPIALLSRDSGLSTGLRHLNIPVTRVMWTPMLDFGCSDKTLPI